MKLKLPKINWRPYKPYLYMHLDLGFMGFGTQVMRKACGARNRISEEDSTMGDFVKDLEHLINKYSLENGSDTPDFLLAEYISECLGAYNRTVKKRDKWYGFTPFETQLTTIKSQPVGVDLSEALDTGGVSIDRTGLPDYQPIQMKGTYYEQRL